MLGKALEILFLSVLMPLTVSYIFYKLGGKDLNRIHRWRHIDFLSSKIHLLDPRSFDGDTHGNLGVARTAHLFKCESSVMREYDFAIGADVVYQISEKMLKLCPRQNNPNGITAEKAEDEKREWMKSPSDLRKSRA